MLTQEQIEECFRIANLHDEYKSQPWAFQPENFFSVMFRRKNSKSLQGIKHALELGYKPTRYDTLGIGPFGPGEKPPGEAALQMYELLLQQGYPIDEFTAYGLVLPHFPVSTYFDRWLNAKWIPFTNTLRARGYYTFASSIDDELWGEPVKRDKAFFDACHAEAMETPDYYLSSSSNKKRKLE